MVNEPRLPLPGVFTRLRLWRLRVIWGISAPDKKEPEAKRHSCF